MGVLYLKFRPLDRVLERQVTPYLNPLLPHPDSKPAKMPRRSHAHSSPIPSPPPTRHKSQRLLAQRNAEAYKHTTRADINSLPVELLASIIQHLPWRDRVCAERVNRRWRHTYLTAATVESFASA